MSYSKVFSLCLVGIFLVFAGTDAKAQSDTLIMKQGDRLIGNFVSFDRGKLQFKTPYTSDPISLKWEEIQMWTSSKKFKILNNEGETFIGNIHIDKADSSYIHILSKDSSIKIARYNVNDIAGYDEKLSSRLKLSADIGYTTTKESNTRQASLALAFKYLATRWEFDLDYMSYASNVDTISNLRGTLAMSVKYLLPRNWFLIGQANSFTSTEQQIDYRIAYLLGSGKYLIKRSNKNLYCFFGGTYNREKFSVLPTSLRSAEGFAAVHFEFFPFEHLSISSDVVGYPGITEPGRLRTYSKMDAMVRFARHFRFGAGFVLNTDNRPPASTSPSDYIFNVKLGWAL